MRCKNTAKFLLKKIFCSRFYIGSVFFKTEEVSKEDEGCAHYVEYVVKIFFDVLPGDVRLFINRGSEGG